MQDSTKSLADMGSKCPTFIAERVVRNESDDGMHSVALSNDDGTTAITMIVDDDGGLVTYDDGVTIHRRVFEQEENAIEAFQTAVNATVSDYESRSVEFEASYSPGYEPVELEAIDA